MLRRLAEKFKGMMRSLFRQEGATLDIGIIADPEVREFIDTHASVLDASMEKVEMSDGMRRRLSRSNFIFSGMKTFHELNEAFPSMLDENGNRKSFERFLNDVQKIDRTYNEHYLRAEYNFVNASAEMAARWESFAEDGDRYNLQYRTAGDGKVRPEHAALNGITLPMSDPFWEDFYPPNGWNCRCSVVQVRKSKYPATPHDEAMARGEEALQRDTKGIFRFNPGLEEKTFPDYNPYTIRKCRNCDVAKGKGRLDFIPTNMLCEGCAIINKCYNDLSKSKTAVLRNHYLHEMERLLTQKVVVNGDGHSMSVGFNIDGNKHLYSDTFGRCSALRKEDLSSLDNLLANASFKKKASNSKERKKDGFKRFYYFESYLHGQKVYLNVGETDYTDDDGKIHHTRILYSITNKIK